MSGDKYRVFAKNTVLFTIGSFGPKILIVLMVPLYTNVLSTSDYGNADLIYTSSVLLSYLFTLNIADAVLRFVIDGKENSIVYLRKGLSTLLGGSLILAIVESVIYCLDITDYSRLFFVYVFLVFFSTSLNQLFSNYLKAMDKVKETVIAGLLLTLSTVISSLLFLLVFKLGVDGYIISIVLGYVVSSLYLLNTIGVSNILSMFDMIKFKNIRTDMILYSSPLVVNGMAWWMNNSLDRFFITYICGPSENGLYSVAYKVPTILSVFQTVINQAWNLSAIKEYDKYDNDGFFSTVYRSYNSSLIIICSLLILANQFMAKVLFAKEFYRAWHYTPILLLSAVFMVLSGFVGAIFSAVKKSIVFPISTVLAAVVNVILNAVLIPRYRGYGAAVATAVSFFVIWIIRILCSRKYIAIKIDFVKDMVCYTVLCIQVFIELRCDSPWMWETVLFILLLMMNYRNVVLLLRKVIQKR